MRYAAVIAAAGLSSRMKSFKPLLPLADDTIIGTLIDTLKQAGVADIVVVIGHKAEEMTAYQIGRALGGRLRRCFYYTW